MHMLVFGTQPMQPNIDAHGNVQYLRGHYLILHAYACVCTCGVDTHMYLYIYASQGPLPNRDAQACDFRAATLF
jgi:hypothetical protein